MKVSVVIPNYNGEKFLRECLQSLREQSQPHEVIVVDNASKDGSCALMAREFPEVRVLVQEENLGFAGGVNAGIRAAKGEYVALLNNDTRADEHFLRALVRLMDAHPNAFSASSKMIQDVYKRQPIVMSSTEKYAKFCAVALQSMMDHAGPQNNYDIFILHREIRADTQRRIQSVVAQAPNFSVRFINVKSEIARYDLDVYKRQAQGHG